MSKLHLCPRCEQRVEGQPDQDTVASNVISASFSDSEAQMIVDMYLKGVSPKHIAFGMRRALASIHAVLKNTKYLPKYGPRRKGA